MTLDLFAGVCVTNLAQGLEWYERLLGSGPSFRPNDVEAVWQLADHRFLYIELQPEHAGHAMQTIFVDRFDEVIDEISSRGLEPDVTETYSNGVRKVTFSDPDGNRISYGGAPVST